MPRSLALIMLACALLWPAAFIGCASQDAYRYDTIKAEYADMACNLGKSPDCRCASGHLCRQQQPDPAGRARHRPGQQPGSAHGGGPHRTGPGLAGEIRRPFYPQVNVYTEYLQGDAPSAYLFKPSTSASCRRTPTSTIRDGSRIMKAASAPASTCSTAAGTASTGKWPKPA
jgi:hypothetical protein